MTPKPEQHEKPRLVIIPSDPIEAYERAGLDWLEPYYNPEKMFGEVFVLSPDEPVDRTAHGLTIRRAPERHFRDILREIHPDVVRAYGAHWPIDLACRHRVDEIPVLVSVHDKRPEMVHRAVRYAERVLCVSEAVEQVVLRRGVDPSRIGRLPNRVDPAVFHPVEDRATLDDINGRFPPGKHILQVGRKSPEKNLETIIRALDSLPEEYSAVFVGLGDPAPYIALAEGLGLADRCFWIESVPNSELPGWYSWCDCMCAPSLSEGFGIIFIEAAACGAAIVTSDAAPMNTYLEHGTSAHLVEEYQNPQRMAAAISAVCEDHEYAQRLSAGAIGVTEPFTWERIEAMEAAFYREALALPSHHTTLEERLWRMASHAAPFMRLPGRVMRKTQAVVSNGGKN